MFTSRRVAHHHKSKLHHIYDTALRTLQISGLLPRCSSTRYAAFRYVLSLSDILTQLQMSGQCDQNYRPIPLAQANYDRLCQKHGIVPTAAEVDAIRSVTGAVSIQSSIRVRFETALLFFLPRSAVQSEQGALLIGWVYENDGQVKSEVWFQPAPVGGRSLCHVPGGPPYQPKEGSSTCDEWHPVIFDIVDPTENKNRIVQYAYFRACIKLMEAPVPPPSIERSGLALNGSASTNSITNNLNGPQQEPTITPHATPASSSREKSVIVDLTGSEEEVIIKSEETSASTPLCHTQVPLTQIEARIQAFRDKLDNKEVKELQQMLDKQLPSWIRELAEDVLQKKMFRELELAESLLL